MPKDRYGFDNEGPNPEEDYANLSLTDKITAALFFGAFASIAFLQYDATSEPNILARNTKTALSLLERQGVVPDRSIANEHLSPWYTKTFNLLFKVDGENVCYSFEMDSLMLISAQGLVRSQSPIRPCGLDSLIDAYSASILNNR